jgi:hypothetical protein
MRGALEANPPRRFGALGRDCSLTNRLLTAETPLSYADLQHLSLTTRSEQHLQRAVPAWAFSREAIQAIVLEKLKRYARFTGCRKTEIEKAQSDLAALDALARKSQRRLRRFDNPQFESTYHVAAHLKSVKTRSLAALWIYEIYSAYRLGRNSVDIARQLGITPWAVRQHLFRLNQVARVVCPELCAPARNFGGIRSRETYIDAKITAVEKKIGRASKHPRWRTRVPLYEAQLATLRKMKEQRDGERNRATVFSSANRAA